ncbi:uncharacterized protein [Cicer arietinum]|uniref:Uncharacterized protein LOC101490238 n=1 Tax=Cicer arietinum TaxID=3827 RepID=A0A3Q7YDI7_CICAR|nr:uncharacterized protein LOC101490238 [Cicer arietinum]
MGRSLFLVILLVSSFLFLSFGYGFGRVLLMETVEDGDSMKRLMEHANRKMREVYEIMDYSEPEPNTNPKSGIISSPPPTIIPASPPYA